MRFLLAAALIIPAITPATTPLAVTADPQSVEQLGDSLSHALNNADVVLMLELHWTPAWDWLTAEEVAAARGEAAASMDAERVLEARDAGDLPISVQLIEVTSTAGDSAEVRLLFCFADGGIEEEARRAVWREGGWRLLTDHF